MSANVIPCSSQKNSAANYLHGFTEIPGDIVPRLPEDGELSRSVNKNFHYMQLVSRSVSTEWVFLHNSTPDIDIILPQKMQSQA